MTQLNVVRLPLFRHNQLDQVVLVRGASDVVDKVGCVHGHTTANFSAGLAVAAPIRSHEIGILRVSHVIRWAHGFSNRTL